MDDQYNDSPEMPADLMNNILDGIMMRGDDLSSDSAIDSSPEVFFVTDEVVNKSGPSLAKKAKPSTSNIELWEPYYPSTRHYFSLYDHNNCEIFDIEIRTRIDKIDMKEHYSEADDAFILYRQNQFQLEIDLLGTLHTYSSPTSYPAMPLHIDNGGILIPVESLLFHVYAVKQSNNSSVHASIPEIEEFVDLMQLGGPRSKKEFQTPGFSLIVNGRAVYPRLQFRAATPNNARVHPDHPNPNQQYYRIIISLLAKANDNLCFIASRISPRIIVRGQNPGKFQTQKGSPGAENVKVEHTTTTTTTVKSNKRAFPDPPVMYPNIAEERNPNGEGWKTSGPNKYTYGKVGINTTTPQEALTVLGSIMVTGDVIKPSDERIKTNIRPVDTTSQLESIERLKLYDYEVKAMEGQEYGIANERGVLAQELQKVLPHAVKVVKGVTLADGTYVPELLVVQDRALLFETIGATKELGKAVKSDHESISQLNEKLDKHAKEEKSLKKMVHKVSRKVEVVMDFILTEKDEQQNRREGHSLLYITCCSDSSISYISMFGLGPAWTLYILGYFLPILWLCGIYFVTSQNKVKRTAGILHTFTGVLWIVFLATCFSILVSKLSKVQFILLLLSPTLAGLILLIAVGIHWGKQKTVRIMNEKRQLLFAMRNEMDQGDMEMEMEMEEGAEEIHVVTEHRRDGDGHEQKYERDTV